MTMPTWRQAWFQLHWLLGITAGSVLLVIGLSGAVLSFREELIDALNPGGRHVAVQTQEALAPPQLLAAGVLAIGLFVLALSGLYLRWPRRPLDWRAWFTFDPALEGRPFLWGLHSVAGTCALLLYLVFTTTGVYWAFDAVRDRVDAFAGQPRAPAQARNAPRVRNMQRDDAGAVDVAPAWAAFQRRAAASGWSEVILRVPTGAAPTVLFTWLDAHPAHERARNRMTVRLPGGEVAQDERHDGKPLGGRFLAAIYPLHMGTYFGLPGRIAMMLAALMLPVFTVTGWMLYLDRRRKKRAVAAERSAFAAGAGRPPADSAAAPEGVLVAFASQSGTAEGIALRSAAALEAGGLRVTVASLARLDPEQLRHHQRLLLVASSFGEGGPPDAARRFAQRLVQVGGDALAHLRYGLLALGDRHYARFCGFGHALDHALVAAGAQSLFPMIEVDNGDTAALARWRRQLVALRGADAIPAEALADEPLEPAFEPWTLNARRLLNPGSLGAPLYEIELAAPPEAAAAWRPGALAELQPRLAADTVAALLRATSWTADAPVVFQGRHCTLAEALARSAVPAPQALVQGLYAQALADALVPLATRRYSIASLPSEGHVRLLVRQARHEQGLGIASGWLTAHAPLMAQVPLRLLANPGFAPVGDDRPCIFVGNGSGYAGLRGHLRERIERGHRRNWLVFGERQLARDAFFMDELRHWQAAGQVERVDLAFSRDHAPRIYVQDRLREHAGDLRRWVGEGAAIFVCGSLHGMAAGVDEALEAALGRATLDDLIAEGRYRRDVY